MTQAEAIKKVQKLLRLSQDSAATPEEAARAAEMAQALMTRHELDAAVASLLEPEAIQEEVKSFNDPVDTGFGRWRGWLLSGIARLHGCQPFQRNVGTKSPHLCLIGRPSDVETVRYLYTMIVAQTENIATRETRGHGICWAKNFRIGMVETIVARMRAAHEQAKAQFKTDNVCTALVLVNNAIALREKHLADAESYGKNVVKLRAGGRPTITYDGAARAEGREAGQRVNIGGGAKGGMGAGRKELGE